MTTPLTKTEQGKIYALKLYRFYREQGLPPFMAMAAVIDSGRAIANNPTAYIPKATAQAAMSVWAGQQYMQWIQARMIAPHIHSYWFSGRMNIDTMEAVNGMYEEVPGDLDT